MPADPPLRGSEWEKSSFREHARAWNQQVVGDGNALPHVVYVFVVLKLSVYVALFWFKLRDADLPLFGEQNFKRFLLYNMLGDLLGTNASSGPLAFRLKFTFVAWYNLFMPGSITAPLVPGVPSTRNVFQSIGYLALLYLLVAAVRAPTIAFEQIAPIAGTLTLLVPFDLVTFFACRGEHYGYMLICCLAPWQHALTGCQLVQLALWFFAGTSKAGPWMKYVMCFMMPNSLLMRMTDALGVLRFKWLFVEHPKDLRPHPLLKLLADFGCTSEMLLAGLCASGVAIGGVRLGVFAAIGFHCFIISMFPFASVMEWNVVCLYMILHLFEHHSLSMGAVSALIAEQPLLSAFLAVVLLAIPIFGQLLPKRVPFLAAYRPYAGNWRKSWHVVDAKALHKLRKLKTLEGPLIGENAQLLWGSNPPLCEQLEEYFVGNMIFFPHFRPIIPIVEKLKEARAWRGHNECALLFNETFVNAVFGWSLGNGDFIKGTYFAALSSTCGFVLGECYVVVFEPCGLLDHTAEWHVVDVCEPTKKLIHGKAPYADLEGFQPAEMTREMLERCSVLDGATKAAAETALKKKRA